MLQKLPDKEGVQTVDRNVTMLETRNRQKEPHKVEKVYISCNSKKTY